MQSRDAEVRRIDHTGVIWFSATSIAAAIVAAALLIRGWTPSDLPTAAAIVWWIAAAVCVVGIALLGWAGCPVLGPDLDRADRQKSVCVRVGVLSFLVGAVTGVLVILA
jgi:hypothetical protein